VAASILAWAEWGAHQRELYAEARGADWMQFQASGVFGTTLEAVAPWEDQPLADKLAHDPAISARLRAQGFKTVRIGTIVEKIQ
jgi:hypothetical protein